MPTSRRAFLRLSGGLATAALWPARQSVDPPEWTPGVRLGRMTESRIRLYNRPNPAGREVAFKYRDEVVTIVRDIVGLGFYPHNHVWYETPDGYAYSSWVQPVRYAPAEAGVEPAPDSYAEVTVPSTEAHAAPDQQSAILYRLYYATTYQLAGQVSGTDSRVWYQLHDENVVKMYALAQHLSIIPAADLTPLSPGATDKRIVVDLGEQSLTAYEERRAVFRTRIASGRNFFGPDGSTAGSLTPAGEHPLWQKRIARHMTGGTPTDGYDLPGVPSVCYFSGNGAAVHGTYWHNDYGTPKSAGCINVRPEDARWLFRWTLPEVPYAPGHITVEWPGGTRVSITD
jgi:lipoprotein-anchoring transpeptidase ErfK/SrfK